MQQQPGATQRELAERVGISQNSCWRRLKRLETEGVLLGLVPKLDRGKLGLDLVVFMMLRTRHHSERWLREFRAHVTSIPEITDVYRIGGDYDYLLKVVTEDMKTYDRVYRTLIKTLDLETVTSYFSMEAIAEGRPLPVGRPG